MNKRMEKAVAKAVVGMAVKSAKLPNQVCFLAFGKPKEQMDLAVSDYENLENFMKHSS